MWKANRDHSRGEAPRGGASSSRRRSILPPATHQSKRPRGFRPLALHISASRRGVAAPLDESRPDALPRCPTHYRESGVIRLAGPAHLTRERHRTRLTSPINLIRFPRAKFRKSFHTCQALLFPSLRSWLLHRTCHASRSRRMPQSIQTYGLIQRQKRNRILSVQRVRFL